VTAAEIHARTLTWERFRILGLDLLPLTLGHVRVMEALGCRELRDPGELGMACWVCSMPAEKVRGFLGSWFGNLRLWLWGRFLGEWDFLAKRQDFADYMRCNTELPEIVKKDSDERQPTRIPSAQAIRVRLMSDLGVSPGEIDGYPFLQALWDLTSLDVLHGRAEMLDETSRDIDEKMDRRCSRGPARTHDLPDLQDLWGHQSHPESPHSGCAGGCRQRRERGGQAHGPAVQIRHFAVRRSWCRSWAGDAACE
jgi:hypothetical protein